MKKLLLASAGALFFSLSVLAQTPTPAAPEQVKDIGTITVTSGRPTSLPSQIPTTMEGIKAAEIAQNINATDSEDALKYLPSLLIRKRYIGDYNHAVLASRASGTNNSARSAVYADGILLSNFLGNGASYAPRWGMVTPEEIDRVDVLYGPFSAAYPGNSVGAIVDYQTKMPTSYEAHAKIGYASSPFNLYGTSQRTSATQASASVGNKNGDWAWWMNFSRQNSASQPLVFVTKTPCTAMTTPACATTVVPVNGAVPALSPTNAAQQIFGTTTTYNTVQDHAKIKLAYDINGTLKAMYSMGYWQNQSEGRPQSYVTNATTGAAVYSGTVSTGGNRYVLGANDFSMTNEMLRQMMQTLSLKSNTKERFDYEVAISSYRYLQDDNRTPSSYVNGMNSGAGTIANGAGTGWTALALKGTYRPDGLKGTHIYDFGYQRDAYALSQIRTNITGNWTADSGSSLVNQVGGNTKLQSVWGQDTWRVAKDWKAVLGLRGENWTASNGLTNNPTGTPAVNTAYAVRTENALSPKAALSFQAKEDVVLKASMGRAVRFPTVQELYGNVGTTNSQYVNDPNLAPEKSVTSEWSMEKDLAYQNGGTALLRTTAFFEDTRQSLYSQNTLNTATGTFVSRVSNIGRIKTSGLEVAYQGTDIGARGLDVSGSLTYTESKIVENSGFVSAVGDTIGKYQPRVPVFRATGLLGYRWSEKLSTSIGARYSGVQYTTLNNSDVNGYAYTAASRFFVVDMRLRYKIDKETTFAFGIDNLNNYTYWNFHPYPQRTMHAELRVDWK